jgi:T5SS/PEP-CTERM-associated repeat protein
MMNRLFRNAPDLTPVLVALLMSLLAARPADAVQTNWNTTSNGNFSNAGNWDNGVPDNTKVADFGLGAVSYTVTYNGATLGSPPPQYQCNQLIVSGANNVTFVRNSFPDQIVAPTLTATSTDTTHTSPGLVVGRASGDNATLNDSILTSATEGIVGFGQGSTGTLNVSGAGMNFSELTVGYLGFGTVNISGGAHVTGSGNDSVFTLGDSGGGNYATVTGAGTTLQARDIIVGGASQANSMTISAGAQVSDTATASIGYNSGSSGTVVVDGASSSWTSGGSLYVGQSGTGALQITGGAQVNAAVSTLGDSDGSYGTVTVDGDGSKWTAGRLTVGTFGSATVYLSHGAALVSTSGTSLGSSGFSVATVVVDGAGTTWSNDGGLSIANGTLSVTGGASVSSTGGGGSIGVGALSIASATVDGAGSTWTISGGVNLGSSIGTGTLTVRNGGLVSVGSPLAIAARGTLQGDGTISGTVTNGGLVAPGATIGALTINGNYTQTAAGTLAIELAGPASFDRLLVSGSAALDGTIAVALGGGFTPTLGETFSVLTFTSESGDFATYTGLALGGHLTLHHSFVGNSLILAARPALDGDINLDGVVNGLDIAAVSSHWLLTGQAAINGDANGDGVVNGLDIALIASHWLQTGAGGGGTGTAVPEPSAIMLAAVGAVVLLAYRRR